MGLLFSGWSIDFKKRENPYEESPEENKDKEENYMPVHKHSLVLDYPNKPSAGLISGQKSTKLKSAIRGKKCESP